MKFIFLSQIAYFPQSNIAPFLFENLENFIDREKSSFTNDIFVVEKLILSYIANNLKRWKDIYFLLR